MLQSIRDYTQGWIAGIIISLLILSFALWGIHSYLGTGASNTAAKVNGVEITHNQLSVAYERMRRQLQMQYNSSYQLPEQAEANLKERALQALINIEILKQASLNKDYRISSSQIDSFLETMPEFQVNGQFSAARFQQLLETTLYNTRDFLELIKTSLLIDQPRLGLIFTSFALPDEIVDSIALINQERDLQSVVFPIELIAKEPINIANEKVQSYYQQHQDDFKTPEQVSVEYIELSLNDLMSNIHPTDAMVKNYYTENGSSYTEPMQWKFDSIAVSFGASATEQDIKKAQQKADDIFKVATTSNKNIADLIREFEVEKGDSKLSSWVTINQIPSELQKSVLRLNKIGQIAEPVRVNNSFVILKTMAIKEPVVQPLAQVKDKVLKALIHQQAEEKFADLREKMVNLTYEHPDSLEIAAKTLNFSIKTTELFTKNKGGNGITANTKIREAAFSNEVLNLKNNSEVIQTNGDNAIVIRIKSHSPATLLSLKTVEKQILDKLKSEAIEERSAQLTQSIVQKLQHGDMSLEQVAKQYNLTLNNIGFIGRHSNKIDSAILETAFAMPKPQSDTKLTFATAKVPAGYAIVALRGVRDGAAVTSGDKDKEHYQVFAEQIQNTQGLMEYELYKQSLMLQAKVSVEN